MPTGLALYTKAAEAASSRVIGAYSTSFGWATKLLGKDCRQHVENIYALVRVADEVVDGAAAEAAGFYSSADLTPGFFLSELELEVYRTLASGYSTNLVVHAFATTAIKVGIDEELIRPFFSSMRADLTQTEHSRESFERYVYGSAEVVGLMCLKVFTNGRIFSEDQTQTLIAGARALGSAFQKVNFLRDLAADFKALGRSYFPGVNVKTFNEEQKLELVADIQAELDISAKSIALLPKSSRRAVMAAQMLFEELNNRIKATPAEQLITTRISVPNLAKLGIIRKAVTVSS
jgi:phytoene/squalene synthetase